ncbi:MAG: low molecular weight protein-tyrosine-phosphatase [Anaeromyxobacteraceae bacterium]
MVGFDRVLVVCVGNICRSPMAAVLLEARLRERGASARVESAGLAALVGEPAAPLALELVGERGLDLSAHRARQLGPALVRGADLVLVMEHGHQRAVEAFHPPARGRVIPLGRWGGFDVPDPHRRGRAAFEEALALIERGIDDLERVLAGPRAAQGRSP